MEAALLYFDPIPGRERAAEWVNIKIPFLTGMNRQEMLLDKGSLILNLEWKALKITF